MEKTDQSTINSVMEPPAVGERIYIGGLNPPRLSGKDILRRLKSLQHIEIESASTLHHQNSDGDGEESDDTYDNRPYLHFTAISKNDSDSALSIIRKQYHGVKWKGCKLVVESAKPHFLERLEQERLDQQRRLKPDVTTAAEKIEDLKPDETKSANFIPRRLRVRKKHGDAAFHVDTKPWTVESWSRFNKARSKQKTREEKYLYNAAVQSESSTPLMHRAVHIRFLRENNCNSDDTFESPSHDNNCINEIVVSSSQSASSSDSEDEPFNQDNGYQWSDDETDSQNSDGIKNGFNQNSNDVFLNQELDNAEPKETNRTHSYSEDEDAHNQNANIRDDTEKHLGDNEDHEVFDVGDLTTDVTTNLNVLSSIFPDMAKASPLRPEREENSNIDKANSSLSSNSKRKLVHEIMPRYDPTAKSNRFSNVDYECIGKSEEVDSTNRLSSEGESDTDSTDKSSMKDDEKTHIETNVKAETMRSVYEQDKLENVFRNARSAWGTDTSGTQETTRNKDSSSGNNSFNFGFQIDDNAVGASSLKEKSSLKTTFNFGFNIDDNASTKLDNGIVGESSLQEKPVSSSCVRDGHQGDTIPHTVINDDMKREQDVTGDDSVREMESDDLETPSKGFTLSDENLRKHVANFFSLNDGDRIMQNPREFMNDENEREVWNSERKTLTLDWKRKRKYAITRIQKRMKVQRR